MTKIEEKAKEWSDNHFDEDYRGAAFISYVKGADDQRSIDIEKACIVIHNMMVDGYEFNLSDNDYIIDAFRNAMNEPKINY